MSANKKAAKAHEAAQSKARSATYVGAAGWSIPSRYKDNLPGTGSHLERYAQRLNAVEINSSFHRHHREQTYARWAASVPVKFRFAVKTPRALTHEQGLIAEPEVLDRFVEEISGLGSKLAVLLVQLPPKFKFDRKAATRFFRQIYKRIDVRIACEPRHRAGTRNKRRACSAIKRSLAWPLIRRSGRVRTSRAAIQRGCTFAGMDSRENIIRTTARTVSPRCKDNLQQLAPKKPGPSSTTQRTASR